ncbi:MAG: hypothetical protein GY757_07450 [bacterium]|nr:hypothetical protein [bacterium]
MAEIQLEPNKKTYRKPSRTFEKFGAVNPKDSFYVPLENVVNSDSQDIKIMVGGSK